LARLKSMIKKYIFILFIFPVQSLCAELPDANSISALAENVEQTITQFNQQSLEFRLKLAFEGSLCGADRDKFVELVKDNKEKIENILTEQSNAKKAIEEYEGDDWDQRYGTTNLWRKLGLDIKNTQLTEAKLNLYLAKVDDPNIVIADVLKQVKSNNDPNEILQIADELQKKDYSKEPQTVLELAGLLRKHNLISAMEKLFERYPAVANLAGRFICEEMKQKNDLQNYSIYEIELAVKNLPQEENLDNDIFEKIIAVEKFQTPMVLYAAALAAVELNPQLSVDCLLQTAELLKHSPRKNEPLNIEAVLTLAGNIAYSSFTEGRIDCKTALNTFEIYLQTIPQPEDKIVYPAAIVYQKCGNIEKAISLFDTLAQKADSTFKRKAALSLIELGQTTGSIPAFLSAVKNDCNAAPFAIDFLKESLEIIEKLAESKNFSKNLNNLTELAKITCDCLNDSRKETAAAFYVEFSALKGIDHSRFAMLNNMIETASRKNPYVIRALARLEQSAGNFEKSAAFWSSLADGFEKKDSLEAKNWYWRAKYYELYNYEKTGDAAHDKARHAIDVQLNDPNSDIAPFWAAKFEQLRITLDKVR